MDEINYGELFGVDMSENTQEVAEPVEPEETQGENEQEVAEPVEAEQTTEEKRVQSKEDNARFAAARRAAEAERDAAIRKAQEDAKLSAQKTIDEAFKNSGLINPYTQKQITSKAEYDAYKTQYEAEKRENILKQTGMSDKEFSDYVNDLPEVRAAKEATERARAAEKSAREAEAKADIDAQIKRIGQIDPSIKSLEDITKADNYSVIYGYVKKGNTIEDAFKLANYDKLVENQAKAAKQAALNLASSKEHLQSTKAVGKGSKSVPKDEMKMFKLFNPNASDKEIQEYFNRYDKE